MTDAIAGGGGTAPTNPGSSFAFSFGEPTYSGGLVGTGTGIQGAIAVTNGETAIADNQIFLWINAEGQDNQTESVANAGAWLHAFAPFETRTVSAFVEADGGNWTVTMGFQDVSGGSLGDTDAKTVHVNAPVHHAHAFRDGAFQYTIEITSIHADDAVITVRYRIHNDGSAPIPAGFPISIAYAEPDGAGSNQVYAIEVPVHPGQAGDKHLTVEGANTHAPGVGAQLWLTGDEGGAAEKTFQFNVNWESADTATATPA